MADQKRHDDTTARTSPGASGPGEQGYSGEATIGDEGAAAGNAPYQDSSGRPGPPELADDDSRTGEEQAAVNVENDPPA